MAAKSRKGSKFEREICKALSLWWSENERDDIFYRTSSSGARATQRRKKGLETADSAGDMMAIHESGKPFTKVCLFEFKRGYSDKHEVVKTKKGFAGVKKTKHGLEILTILDKLPASKDPILLEWWSKLEIERMATKRRYSFIIFRRDQKVSCVAMSRKAYNFISKRNGPFDDIMISVNFNKLDHLETLVIMRLDDFMIWCQPKCFLNAPRQIKRRKKNVGRKKRRKTPA